MNRLSVAARSYSFLQGQIANLARSVTMHMKIVIVVTRTFWRCAACKLLRKKTDSIDHHLKSCHPQFISAAACRTNVSDSADKTFDKNTLSDSEIVDKLRDTSDNGVKSKCVQNTEDQTNPFSCTVPPTQSSGGHCGIIVAKANEQDAEKSCAFSDDGQYRTETRRITRKKIKRSIRQAAVDTSDLHETSDSDVEADSDSFRHVRDVVTSHTEKGAACKKRKLKTFKPRSAYVMHSTKSSCPSGGRRTQNSASGVGVASDEKKGRLVSLKGSAVNEKVMHKSAECVLRVKDSGAKRGRRLRMSQTDQQADDFFEPMTSRLQFDPFKPDGPSAHSGTNLVHVQENFAATDESNTNKKGKSVSTRISRRDNMPSESTKKQYPSVVKQARRPVDKTRIATSCAPWLFGSGRKAGDKVNKKPRRLLLPEEKQAVRELYGIPANEQLSKSLAGLAGSSDSELGTVEVAQPDVTLAATVLHTFPVQNSSSREDHAIAHRNFLLSIFPSGPDFARASGSLFSGYEGMLQQQSEQYAVQSTDLCQMAAGNSQLPQRNFTHYPAFCPVTPGLKQSKGNNQQNIDMSLTPLSPPPDRVQDAAGLIRLNPKEYSAQGITFSAMPSATQIGSSDGNLPQEDVQTTGSEQKVSSSQASQGVDSQEKECGVCLETFASTDLKQKHQQECSSFGVAECKRCKHKFHGMHQLNVHVFSEHETEKQGFCFICNQDEEGLESLEKHVHKHAFGRECTLSDLKYHNCRICKEEIHSVYATIRTHYYQHHIAHVCGECFQNFSDIAAYTEHCQMHSDRVVFCSICGAQFLSAEKLKSHFPCAQDAWAEDGMGSQCYKCGLWCPNKAVREAHRKQHRSQEDVEAYRKGAEQGFPCVSCEKVFKNKHACRRHMKMVHEGLSCYKHYCEYCGKGFLTKGHMRDHTAMHHLGIKRYQCQYCDQKFVCGPTLRRHVRKEHTKHKPYECEHCGERFFEKTPLQRHLTTHTGLAPFMCEHCGKGFYTKHSFTNHGTTHSSVRDFVCKGCQKGFTRKYNLQAHMKICKLV